MDGLSKRGINTMTGFKAAQGVDHGERKEVANKPSALILRTEKGQTQSEAIAHAALRPSVNAAMVMQSYQGSFGGVLDINALVNGLSDSCKAVNDGDLATMEAMLISQATALQTIFTSLARRAQTQKYQQNLEAFLGLALKAQAQSRATISALVDLKYPRQATFVKQANIANGPQQVNNGVIEQTDSHARQLQTEQNKLLEGGYDTVTQRMDSREAQTSKRSNPAVETVGKVHRAKKS
jgi:hypothetical protein